MSKGEGAKGDLMTPERLNELWAEHGVAKEAAYSEVEYDLIQSWFKIGAQVGAADEGYEFEGVKEPTKKGKWWVLPEGVNEWIVVHVYEPPGDRLCMVHLGVTMEVGDEHYKRLFERALWAGPLDPPKPKSLAELVHDASGGLSTTTHRPGSSEFTEDKAPSEGEGLPSEGAAEEGDKLGKLLWEIYHRGVGKNYGLRDWDNLLDDSSRQPWIMAASLFRAECIAPYKELEEAARRWLL